MRTTSPRAAVFDCDGLLVESAGCWRQAYELVLLRQERRLEPDLLTELNGASISSAAAALGIAPDDIAAELETAFRSGALTAKPGACELLSQLERRLPIAVATNAPKELVELALNRVGLNLDLPIVSADGMPGKPAPDVYLAACQRLGVEPHLSVALEDSPVGAAAAKAAGLTLIYVPSGEPASVTPELIVRRLDDPSVCAVFGLASNPRATYRETSG